MRAQQSPTNPQPDSPGLEKYGPPTPSTPSIAFIFDRPGLPVPSYTIRIDTLFGSYEGQEVLQTERNSAAPPVSQPFKRPFTVSAAMADKVVALAHSLNNFNVTCASKAKNIADTGKKTLSYLGPEVHGPLQGSCTYNYSENKDVQALTQIFQGMAETMDQGRRLDFLHRFDRLGLDDAIASLTSEVSEGRAFEIGTIEPSLRSIVADSQVMQRVRTKAAALLALIPANGTTR
jgi:hypothetical protein